MAADRPQVGQMPARGPALKGRHDLCCAEPILPPNNEESQGWPLNPWLSVKKEEKRIRFSAWPMMTSRRMVPPYCSPWSRGCSPAMSHATASEPSIPQLPRVCSMEARRIPYAQRTGHARFSLGPAPCALGVAVGLPSSAALVATSAPQRCPEITVLLCDLQ